MPQTEVEVGTPAAHLDPYVSRYMGYRLVGYEPGLHTGLPARHVTLMINLGAPVAVASAPGPAQPLWSMQAALFGLSTRPTVFRHDGHEQGIAVNLTPLATRAVFGLPAAELTDAMVVLDDLLGRQAATLVERLHAASDWPGRFAVLDDYLTRLLLDRVPEPPAEVRHAWNLLTGDPPVTDVAALARELGWSRRHLTRRFNLEAGLPPRQLRRVVRFERSCALLHSGTRHTLTDVAIRSGYFDQPHLLREWRQLAGKTPQQWLAEQTPSVTYGQGSRDRVSGEVGTPRRGDAAMDPSSAVPRSL